ncbi:MAG TPA: autotransporter-associated beta strand repeat-containing protein [Alphaproteobacteria bacterium]|nr:autotransporter-associated beta strand repeat-containing protein [Alphaproteobacteria bacterium]
MPVLAIFLAATASAQPQPLGGGIGWSSYPVKFNIQWPTNVAEDQRYWFTNNIYHCQVFSNDGAFEAGSTTLPRTEQRFESDYTNGGSAPIGEIQYQSMEMVPSNENSYCVFQIHSGDAEEDAFGSTTFMFFWFTNNNGSLWDYSGKELVKNLGNQWYQVNVDHNLVNHSIRAWINQQLVWTQQDNGAGDFYFKDGCYEQDHNPTLEMDTYVTNILMWTNSGSPIVPLTWIGWTNGLNDSAWDIATDTNWVNSTNRQLQFYQDAGTVTFNSSDPPGQASTPFVLGGSPVIFDDTAPGTTTVNVGTMLQPAGVTVSNNVKNYTLAGSGSIGGSAVLLKEGSGVLTNSLANAFTGGVELNGGIVNADAVETPGVSGPFGSSGTISFAGGTLQYNASAVDTADYSSRFSAAPGQQYSIDVPMLAGSDYSAALTITFASALSSGGASFAKNGGGSLILSAANTFSGPVTVNAGQLRANSAGAFNGNPVTETADGAQVYLNSAGTYGGTCSIVGYGVAESDGLTRLGAIRMATAGVVLSNTITLTGNAGISARGSGATGDSISGQITGAYGIQFGRTSTMTSAGSGTITLYNAQNNWTGDTTIADGTLKLGASGVIPNGNGFGNLVLTNAGTGYNSGIAGTVFDLDGFSQGINGLSNAVGVAGAALNMLWVTNSGTSPVTLTVGNGTATGNFGGIISGHLSLSKTGTGAQTLGGANTYTGNTSVNGGSLALTGSGSIANSPEIIIGNGIFDVSGLSSPFILGAAQIISNSAPAALINGNIDSGTGTLSLNAPAFPALLITNGTLTLSSGTGLKINNNGAQLLVGVYPLIEGAVAGNPRSVTGTMPSSFTVSGGGIVTGATASLQISRNTLDLVVTSPVPRITSISLTGTTLTLTAANGADGGQYVLLGSTNLTSPLNQWTPILTNNFDGSGNLRLSMNILNPAAAQFYILSQP